MLAVVVAEGVAIALLAVLVLGLLRSHALIMKALHELGAGLELETDGGKSSQHNGSGPVPVQLEQGVVSNTRPPHTKAAEIIGSTLRDEEVSIPVTGEDRRTLVAFLSSGCSVCATFWEELSGGDTAIPGGARLVVVTKGPEEESVTRLRQLAGDSLDVVQSSAAWTDYGVPGSPYFVYVEDGQITGEGSSTTWAQVADLMGQAVDDIAEARRKAGRKGPWDKGSGDRDDLARIDRELLHAGIHPGHTSMYEPPDTTGGVPTGTTSGTTSGTAEADRP